MGQSRSAGPSPSAVPSAVPSALAPEAWAAETLGRLSLRQKVAQMVMAMVIGDFFAGGIGGS